MIYLILRKDGTFQFYGNLTLLCNEEGLGYSKFSKYFAENWHYKDGGIEIWKGELNRGTKAS